MSQHKSVNSATDNLTHHDWQPIHIPGSIQPHGMLFLLKEPELRILQVSDNTFEYIRIHPQELLQKLLEEIVDTAQINSIKECLLTDFENTNPLDITIEKQSTILRFDGIVHRSDGAVILELELKNNKVNVDFFNFYQLVKNPITSIKNASTLYEMCQILVQDVRKITGFDRVMVYQFDAEGSGKVIAEDKLESMSSYLDLHYPPVDIPPPARQLFTLNFIRLIPDINAQPVPLIPLLNPETNQPLDLSLSILRSVYPCHIEYLHNMEATASMSISLIKNKKLWGLIACHHQSVKHVPYEIRTACEFLGRVMSLELTAKEENENWEEKLKTKSILSKLIEKISLEDKNLNSLVKEQSHWLDLVSAQGVTLCSQDTCVTIGKTPQEEDLKNLITWLDTQIQEQVFYTDSLAAIYPEASNFKEVVSGILAFSISKVQKYYIVWFRPEVIQTVNWGGNPNEQIVVEQDGAWQLSPRKSFEIWKQTVRYKSLPWKPYEIEAALELRNAMIGLMLRRADELAKINQELERSNLELDAFAYIASHDLKEPLRGIHNYSSFLLEDYADVLDEEGVSKLQTLVRLTQRMEDLINSLLHFSRLGRMELSIQETDLNEVVKSVVDVLKISFKGTSVNIQISQPLPVIQCDRIQVSEVFSNLITNAIKYNNKAEKWVEIGFLTPTPVTEKFNPESEQESTQLPKPIVFYVRDNGIGIREKHQEAIFRIFKRLHPMNKYGGGTGAGLTIAKKIVERHGGRIWVESTYGEGSTFYFTLQSEK